MPPKPATKDDSVYDDTRSKYENQRQRAHSKDKTLLPLELHVAALEQGTWLQRLDEDGDDRSQPRRDEYRGERSA
jgi:hypothetical protein